MAAYDINSNISESQVESFVSTYLGWCSAGMPFVLLDVDEQLTGADKLFDITVPIYVQFKKSLGLKSASKLPISRRKNASARQSIRQFRHDHHLADDPTLYFELREQAATASDLQHNILLAHHQPGRSYAIYVAPLHLKKAAYHFDLFHAPRFMRFPWKYRPTKVLNAWGRSSWLSRFSNQPFLRSHISIAPHSRVSDHKHAYAFSTSGDEVSWHSPEIFDGSSSRLSEFMSERTQELLRGDGELTTPSEALGDARKLLDSLEVDAADALAGENDLDRLQSYGTWLHKRFHIRQILICTNKEFLNEARQSLRQR